MSTKQIGSLDPFTRQYIQTAFWSSTDDAEHPLDVDYIPTDLDPQSRARMVADCAKFQADNETDIDGRDSDAGHDFWLTRNGHGAGFWDGDWPEPQATRLADAAEAFGECYLYTGDDGQVHAM